MILPSFLEVSPGVAAQVISGTGFLEMYLEINKKVNEKFNSQVYLFSQVALVGSQAQTG